MQTYLKLKWSTSRGVDTYGYNICTLTDNNTDKKYRCMGGGYDMQGTVVGEWLESTFQDRLLAADLRGMYGVRRIQVKSADKVSLDGACGVECMWAVAKKIGMTDRQWVGTRRGVTEGWIVTFEDI